MKGWTHRRRQRHDLQPCELHPQLLELLPAHPSCDPCINYWGQAMCVNVTVTAQHSVSLCVELMHLAQLVLAGHYEAQS